MDRHGDGSAGDADYGVIGAGYADYRRPDPRLAAVIDAALGDAVSVLNVGAGAGSYEPRTRSMTAVEPSATMRARRPVHLPPAIDAVAGALPFDDHTFDAAMTTFSVHQWPDLARGLGEMRRVTRGPVLVLTADPLLVARFWLSRYAPEVLAVEARRYPPIDHIAAALGPVTEVRAMPIPRDCSDGFQEAYFGRPEMFLNPAARRACSAWSFVDAAVIERLERDLARDLASGAWDARHGPLREAAEYHGSLRLIIGRLGPV